MAEKRTLLAVFAHPDDESFGSGGALAHYAAEGVQVVLVCATRGEVGEIADPTLATPETLGQVREAELRCACQALGIDAPILLGYRDSGMAGTAANNDLRAFVNAPADEVVAWLVNLIRRLQPQVVLTFDPDGGYGHPDHIAIHRHTLAAFHVAADPTRCLEQGRPWRPARLVYPVFPRSFFQEMRRQIAALGLEVADDRLERDDLGWPDDQVHITLDVSGTVEAKQAALRCHRTQFGPNNPFNALPEEVLRQMIGQESFALAWPKPAPGLRLPDLFAGL